MRFYVPGCSGMLGNEVLGHLAGRAGIDVIGLSRRELTSLGAGLPHLVTPAPLTPDWLASKDTAASIVHCIGMANPRRSFASFADLLAEEVAPQVAMIEGLVARGWRGHLVFLSSGGTVYGDVTALPILETAPLSPKSDYGLSKILLEESFAFLARRHGFRLTVLRVANPYGATICKLEQGVIPLMIEAALTQRPFALIGTGQEQRDYLHISDFRIAVEKACLRKSGQQCEIINIGSGKGTSLNELMRLISELTGKNLTYAASPSVVDVKSSIQDISKARRALNWSPQIGIEQGLRTLLALENDNSSQSQSLG